MRHLVFLLAMAAAAQTGVPPRPASANYPAHNDKSGAAIVPSAQVSKVFSNAVARDYVVVEFAIYPEAGRDIDLQGLDFALNDGADSRAYPATPEEAAWHGRKAPASSQGPHVVAEAGFIVGGHAPPTVYGSVGVDNRPAPPPPPPTPADDPYAIESRLRAMAFPVGLTGRPAAGYLYFPKASTRKPKNGVYGLEYSQSGERKELALPLK